MVTESDCSDDLLWDLATLPTMAQPTAHRDAGGIALYYDQTGRNELHVLDVATGELAQWSEGDVPRDAGWWIKWGGPDRLFYHHDEAGNEQHDIHAIERDGTSHPVFKADGQVVLHDVSPAGETLLLGSSHGGQMNLYLHQVDTEETVKVTDADRAVHSGVLGPNGDRIAYSTNESDEYHNYDVFVAEADGSNPRNLQIGDTGAEAFPTDWHPDADRLLIGDNTPDLSRCGVYDLETNSVTWVGHDGYEEAPECFLPDGERFIGIRTRETLVVPVVYDPATGEAAEFDLPDGVAGFGQNGTPVLDESHVAMTQEGPTRRRELLAYDLESDESEVLLEADYGPFDPEDFADAEFFTVESDGVPQTPARAVEHDPYEALEIEGLLYDPGVRPAPLIVNPHGGPPVYETKDFDVFDQFLASRGYAVLQVNYRGSAGLGREFKERLYHDWGGAEQGDVATAAEHVLDTYDWIDEDCVAVYGRSFGGYSANWQLVQYPELYDAGIAWVGVSDLQDMYENTMPHFRSELMVKYLGEPEENTELYAERSPVNYVENIDCPMLIMHGVNDTRVPVSQARLFREALETAGFEAGEGADFEYVELGAEGHSSSDIERKVRVFTVLEDFLSRRLERS